MNYYAEAIDIITKRRSAAELILTEIAKINPGAIVAGYKSMQLGNLQAEVLPMLRAGQKVTAIKRCRELTGWGLKESKDACEALKY